MAHHPLYGALRNLQWAAQMLATDRWPGPAVSFDIKDRAALSLEAYRQPLDFAGMGEPRTRWLERYAAAGQPPSGYSRDLLAGIEWERQQTRERVEAALAKARAQTARQLAQLEARLVRDQQERLINAELDLSTPEAEVQRRAERERERVWRAIREQVAAEREACEKRLAEFERSLEAEATAHLEAVERARRAVMQERAAEMQGAGEALQSDMAEAMGAEWVVGAGPAADYQVDASEANTRLSAADRTRRQAEADREQTIRRQLARVTQMQARLREKIRTGTEIAALAVAQRREVKLELMPGGARRGRDMTAAIAAELDNLWHTANR